MSSEQESRAADALRRLSELATLNHFRVGAVIEAVFGGGPGSAGRRAILRNISKLCPLTVPQIAALRPVSRQYIQTLIDELAAQGLVELKENPSHRRSRLVSLTAAGRAAIAEADAREHPLLVEATQAIGATAEEIEAAADLLARLLDHMDSVLSRLEGKP